MQRIRRKYLVGFHAEANFGASFVTGKLHHDSKRTHTAIGISVSCTLFGLKRQAKLFAAIK